MTTNRALQFHTRMHEFHDDFSDCDSSATPRVKVIHVHRKSCHGDFCDYIDKES